jgi:carbon-monoxide dehydrogenase iron sulfur subunit
VADYTRCHGCQICETTCSMTNKINKGTSEPRVTSVTWDLEGRGVSIICQNCQDAPCMAVCPKRAISRDKKFNRIMVDYDYCIGCRICMAVCPFGAMGFDGEARKIVKCDLCDGDPLCVKLCPYGALQYEDINDQRMTKNIKLAETLREMLLSGKTESQAKPT